MKRPPGLWFLLSAGVLWLSLQDVYGIRATALIFGRSSTTTTTTASPSETPLQEEAAPSTEPSSSTELSNVTKPTLTGVPQIDYVWEPNLPKELNGYNLSDYPFYERVPDPEEIDFKCDGLHDGFYASVPHKCQVYHHCLFGTRFDFLCANYTAFDQRTFICHFVSEVDCENSKKFWHRNDALYVAQSTTTVRPINLNIYTTPPAGGDPITPLSSGPEGARRPAGGRRPYRPNRRRRPQFEYYDDEYEDDEYYEERPRSNRGRKRPRPRPRPVYDDEEYDDYEQDDRYEKRGGNRRDPDRRRPHESRRTESRKRNKDRRKPEYDDDVDEEVDERFEDADFVKGSRRKGDRRPSEKRRPVIEDYEPEVVERKPARKNKRPSPDSEEYDEEPEADTRREKPPRKGDRHKPVKEESKTSSKEDRPIIKPVSGSIYDRPRVAPRINLPVPKNAADKFSYHTAAVKTVSTTPGKLAEEEYYDDYEEEPLPPPPPKRSKYNNRKTPPRSDSTETTSKQSSDSDSRESSRNPTVSATRERNRKPDNSEESVEKPSRPKYGGTRSKYVPARTTTPSNKRPIRPVSEEYYDEYEEEEPIKEPKSASKISKKERPTPTTTTTTTSTTTPSTTTSTTTTTTNPPPSSESAPRDKHEPIVRIVKRPFLPSRGGNPFSARGLQPVGTKAFDKPSEQDTSASNSDSSPSEEQRLTKTSAPVQEENKSIEKTQFIDTPLEPKDKIEVFKASPVIIKVPIRSKFVAPEVQDEFSIEPSRPLAEVRQNQNNYKYQEFSGPRTTQKPKVLVDKNPLDLNEYDVTLNEALNPTLPNLPVRGFPIGFSSANDYIYNSYTRPRYDSVNSASDSDYVYQNPSSSRHHQSQPHAQRYQTLNFRREAHVPSRTQAIYSSYN